MKTKAKRRSEDERSANGDGLRGSEICGLEERDRAAQGRLPLDLDEVRLGLRRRCGNYPRKQNRSLHGPPLSVLYDRASSIHGGSSTLKNDPRNPLSGFLN
jgi:hypothetical protein